MSDERVIHHYDVLLANEGSDHGKVGWGSAESQTKRFEVFLDIGNLSGAAVLDVGCGLGGFLGFLRKRGIACSYHGIDINPQMIAEAEGRYSDEKFSVAQIGNLAGEGAGYDYVLSSGMLTISSGRQKNPVHRTVKDMFQVARRGVGINFLSRNAETINPGEQYIDPGDMLNFCLALSSQVVVRHDYMPHDVTYFIYPGSP